MRFRLCVAIFLLLALSVSPVAPVYAATINVTTTSDDLIDNGNCTLREAIRAANTNTAVDACPAGSGADTIVLPAGTYTLTTSSDGEDESTGDLNILESLTITGALSSTTIIDGGKLDSVFRVHEGHVTFNDLTIQNGEPFGIYAHEPSEITLNRVTVRENFFGGVVSEGKATISDSGSAIIHRVVQGYRKSGADDGNAQCNCAQWAGGRYRRRYWQFWHFNSY